MDELAKANAMLKGRNTWIRRHLEHIFAMNPKASARDLIIGAIRSEGFDVLAANSKANEILAENVVA
jgi:hypothetical protein